MQQHFVSFLSPGTFVSEESVRPIESWDVDQAVQMARSIVERHGATPYGFRFITRSRSPNDLDSRETARSPTYYLGGTIETYEQVCARNDPKEEILRSNMRCNGYDRIITNNNSWKFTAVLNKDDVVLDFVP
jgi:hypothetical protein